MASISFMGGLHEKYSGIDGFGIGSLAWRRAGHLCRQHRRAAVAGDRADGSAAGGSRKRSGRRGNRRHRAAPQGKYAAGSDLGHRGERQCTLQIGCQLDAADQPGRALGADHPFGPVDDLLHPRRRQLVGRHRRRGRERLLCRRRLSRRPRRGEHRVQQYRADRSAEGPAGHAVRSQQLGRPGQHHHPRSG